MKKIFRDSMALLLAVVLLFSGSAMAYSTNDGLQMATGYRIEGGLYQSEQAVTQTAGNSPLRIDISSKKDKYTLLGKIEFTATITNISNSTVNNTTAKAFFGSSLRALEDGSQISETKDSLAPEESFSIRYYTDIKGLQSLDKLLWPLSLAASWFHGSTAPVNSIISDSRAYVEASKSVGLYSFFSGSYDASTTVRVWYEETENTDVENRETENGDEENKDVENPSVEDSFRFISFSADITDIPIGIQKQVTFTATVETSLSLSDYDIGIYDVDTGKLGTYLQNKGDGVFSWTVTLVSDKVETARFEARHGIQKSNLVEIRFYKGDPPVSPPINEGKTTFTRGQWVQLLAEKINMNLNADLTDYDYFYTDTKNSNYVIAIETARAYGFLPPTGSPLFHPNEIVTREFVAYTLAKALGYIGTYDLDCNDKNSVKFISEASIAIQEGFLTLIDNQFKPNAPFTIIDKERAFSRIDQINASTKVDASNLRSNVVYKEGVIVDSLKTITNYSVVANSNGTYTITLPQSSATDTIIAGKTFVLPPNIQNPAGIVLKAVSVSNSGSNKIITCSKPDISEAITSIDIEGRGGTLDVNSIKATEGVTIEYLPDSRTQGEIVAAPVRMAAPALEIIDTGLISEAVPGELKITLVEKKITEKVKLSGSISFTIPDITYKVKCSHNLLGIQFDELLISITKEIQPEFNLKVTGVDTGKAEIGRVKVFLGTTGFSIDFVLFATVTIDGKVSISFTSTFTSGIHYVSGQLPRLIKDASMSLDAIKLATSATVGIGIAIRLTFTIWDLIGLDVHGGLAIKAIATVPITEVDIILYFYLTMELDTDTLIGELLKNSGIEWSWDIFDEETSPFKKSWRISACAVGFGTETAPYLIASAEQLHEVRDELSAHYKQIADVDLSIYSSWEPIGTTDSPFTGIYDGDGYIIKNMRIDIDDRNVTAGLFGTVESSTLKNIGIVDSEINITGGSFRVGGLAGSALGRQKIDNCFSGVNIIADHSNGVTSYIGGIVGWIGSLMDFAQITNCYNSGNINTVGYTDGTILGSGYIGGIVGSSSSAYIDMCYNTGSIQGGGRVGGIAGNTNSPSIYNSFNTGEIIGGGNIGGITGYNYGDINSCYNVGTVTKLNSADSFGGITGYASWGGITKSYYLDNVSKEIGYAIGNRGNATQLTASQMQQQSSFVGFDFDNVWAISPSINNGYPSLRGLQP